MKKLQILLMSLFAFAAASCTKEISVTEDYPTPSDNAEIENYVGETEKGWIRIKISEDAAPLRSGVFTRGAMDSGNEDMDRIAESLGATEVRRVFNDGGKNAERRRRYGLHLWYDIRFDENISVSRAANEFSSVPGIGHIEPVYIIKSTDEDTVFVPSEVLYLPSMAIPNSEMPFNDPDLGQQWHYRNEGKRNSFTAGADINLFEAWKVEAGDPKVIVSVHDEGVSSTHPDIAPHLWVNEAEKNGAPGVDDDENGYEDDINGWNFISNSGTISRDPHGTHVAGTIAAVNNNGIGVSGVAGGTGNGDGVRIMSLKIIEPRVASAPDSYVYAADNGAVISQNSWTLSTTGKLPASFATAFDYFIENAGMEDTDGDGNNDTQTGPMKGGVIIFAAGNGGGVTLLPAASDKVIAVAAMAPNYNKSSYSSCGPEIDILAPGGTGPLGDGSQQVLSTYVNQSGQDDYTFLWGTSMACPHVSGVAALIVSHFGGTGFTAEDCTKRLLNGYKPMGGLIPDEQLGDIGVGLLDAAAALMDDPGQAPAKVQEPSATAQLNNMVLTWKVPADGNGAAVAVYDVTYDAEGKESTSQKLRNVHSIGSTVTYTIPVDYNSSYDISVVAVDRWGNISAGEKLSLTTGNFENKPPVIKKDISDSNIPSAGSDNTKSYKLSEYFGDPNLLQGDVITYEAVSSNPAVASVNIVEGVLEVIPKAKGTTNITVTATDIAGESVSTKFRISVINGPLPDEVSSQLEISPNPVGDELKFSLTEVSDVNVDVTVYDTAGRKKLSEIVAITGDGKGSLNAGSLSPGVYNLAVKHDGQIFRGAFVKK